LSQAIYNPNLYVSSACAYEVNKDWSGNCSYLGEKVFRALGTNIEAKTKNETKNSKENLNMAINASVVATAAALFVGNYVISLFSRGASLQQRRWAYIEDYQFPDRVIVKVKTEYTSLSEDQIQLVIRGLRDFFQICRAARNQFVSMPSQAVDTAWHEFILFTREYEDFCNNAMGHFLHHSPAEAMQTPIQAQEGIKRAWSIACRRDGIDPLKPERLPGLFAIDEALEIPNGFRYVLDCGVGPPQRYCASHIGCTSSGDYTSGGCGTGGCLSGLFGDSDGGCDGGCGGGCGGD
jgi:hypothetical protein